MSERPSTEEFERARAEIAERDARISAMQCAHQRLQHLYDISKILLRFEDLEEAVAEVMNLVAHTLPLRSAMFILETAGIPRTVAWHADGETAERIELARLQAQTAYNYLAHSSVKLACGDATILELPHIPAEVPKVEVNGRKTFVILPLIVRRGSIFGALQIEGAHTLIESDLWFVNAVVNQLAIALDRYGTEVAVRRVEHEQRFLAELGEALAATLEFSETLASITRLMLAELADVCIIDFVDEKGHIERIEAATSDPTKAALVRALKVHPLDRGRQHLAFTVLQSNRPLLIPELTPEALDSFSQSEAHRTLLHALAPVSLMGVPLIVRGRLVGALLALSCHSARRYGSADLRILEEAGRRAAFALENARLYRIAQRAVKARDDVLGVVAHDLRSPLGTILMRVEALRRPGVEPERRAGHPAEAIRRAVTRMDHLIQDLLEVSRMEAGSLSIQRAPVRVEQALQDVVAAQEPLAASRSLELRLELVSELPRVWADRDRLIQVLENLIGNAIKFTPRGGRVTVGARCEANEVLVWVSDSGQGISGDELPHLFDRFWQSRKGDRRGAGLGLSIAKGIVEAHHGRIWVESLPGHGSTFSFSLPANAVALPPPN